MTYADVVEIYKEPNIAIRYHRLFQAMNEGRGFVYSRLVSEEDLELVFVFAVDDMLEYVRAAQGLHLIKGPAPTAEEKARYGDVNGR